MVSCANPCGKKVNSSIVSQPRNELTLAELNARKRKKHLRTVWRNFLTICFSFFLNFASFSILQILQSSLNNQNGSGVISLALIYATMIISGMCFAAPLVSRVGYKHCIWTCMMAYFLFTAANWPNSEVNDEGEVIAIGAWPKFLYPASVLLGLAAAPMWTAKDLYQAMLADIYQDVTTDQTPSHSVQSFFYSIFFSFFFISGIFGNLVSLYTFRKDNDEDDSQDWPFPYTLGKSAYNANTSNITDACGPKFDNFIPMENSEISKAKVVANLYVFMAFTFVAVLLAASLKNEKTLPNYSRNSTPVTAHDIFRRMGAVFGALKSPTTSWTLVVPALNVGLCKAFWAADFNEAFVTCPKGITFVPWSSIVYLTTAGLVGITLTFVSKTWPKSVFPIILFTQSSQAGYLLVLSQCWREDNAIVWMFVTGVIWGINDTAISCLLPSLFVIKFSSDREMGFALMRMLDSLGWAISLSYSSLVSVQVKMIILWCVMAVSLVSIAIEMWLIRKNRIVKSAPTIEMNATPYHRDSGFDNQGFH